MDTKSCIFITFRKTKPEKTSFELKIIPQMGDSRTHGMENKRSESLGLDQRAFLGVQVALSNRNQERDVVSESGVGCKIFNVVGSLGYCSFL